MKYAYYIGGIIIVGIAVVYALNQNHLTKQDDVLVSGMHRMPDGTLMNHMDHASMNVTTEEDFIREMIPHHQEAVDTSREVLARGATLPQIKALAENIILSQEREINDMKAWYKNWYDKEYQPSGTYQPMMRDLSALSGKELDRVYLEDMIIHHEGAVHMAQVLQPFIERDEMEKLIETILITQSEEINLMKEILRSF
jgi:uncharacterized protein (DUF305 family)